MQNRPANPPLPESYEVAVRQNQSRNYWAHSIEGGLFMGGLAFIEFSSVLPPMVSRLGGPTWMVAAMPLAMFAGFMVMPPFTAQIVERLEQMHRYVIIVSIFQRLPFLLAALALFFLAEDYPTMTLGIVAAAPLISGLFGGLSAAAWMEMVTRLVPAVRRSSAAAIRNGIAATMGLVAGAVIKVVLEYYPGTTGYGILFLLAWVFIMASFVVFSRIKEPKLVPPPPQRRPILRDIREQLERIWRQKRLRQFLLMRFFGSGYFVMLPFLAIHALAVTGEPESFLGSIVLVRTLGMIMGNAMAGWMGDRYGTKGLLTTSRFTWILLAAGMAFAYEPWMFLALFLMDGVGDGFFKVGQQTVALELSPANRRPMFLALMTTLTLPGLVFGWIVAWQVKENFGDNFGPIALMAGALTVISLFYLLPMPDPRKAGPAE